MNAIEVKNLHKKINKKEVIKNANISIGEGEIFGLVGPKNSGKTIIIKMILGLVSPNKGSIKIFEYDIKKNRSFALKDVGSTIGNPEFYTYMSGKQNLKQISRMYGNINKKDIDNVVEFVGLEKKINTKVKKYSFEMKKRLGIAGALLIKPKLLVLDDPMDGLDDSEVDEFKNIIAEYARQNNTTVFITSQELDDISEICDSISFIDNGIIKSAENIDSITAATNEDQGKIESIELITDDAHKCNDILKDMKFIYNYSIENNKISMIAEKDSISKIIRELSKNDISIEEIYKKHQYNKISEEGKYNVEPSKK